MSHGKALKTLRNRLHLTLYDVAQASGYQIDFICKAENGYRPLQDKEAALIKSAIVRQARKRIAAHQRILDGLNKPPAVAETGL